MKRLICFLLVITAVAALTVPAAAAAEPYSDMPKQKWAYDAVLAAYEYGLMEGDKGVFGTGRSITREEFAAAMVKMFRWRGEDVPSAGFDDVSGWARSYINIAAAHDVIDSGGSFRPKEDITRQDMAIMLVRALGYKNQAERSAALPVPFKDVTENLGYIALAYDFGMIDGMTPTTFEPEKTATREQAAAILVRVYERYIAGTQWNHAFYAISSYSQIELAKSFDAVSLGWSRMTYKDGAAALSTTRADGNEYYIPSGYSDVLRELTDAGVKLHLSVFMNDAGGALTAMLADKDARAEAARLITAQVKSLGLSGATVDFEGLYSPARDDFTAFLTELDGALEAEGLTLYVAVMPATADGAYFDGYDYRAVGELADKVILMAHNYAPTRMDTSLLHSTYYKNAALTPQNSVYYSLRAVCDPKTGVKDKTKLALNLSMSAMAWKTDASGLLSDVSPIYPTPATVYSRLAGGAEMGWSDTLQNPYLTYKTEDGQNIFLWYEDERSVEAKLALARMFGVTGVSVWRLGQIPDYPDEGLWFNIADAVK